MSNRYKVVGPRPVCDVEPGAEFEHEFSASEEQALLNGRRIELVPRKYRVVGTRRVAGFAPGEVFVDALRVANESALIEAGHLERVAEPKKKTTPQEKE